MGGRYPRTGGRATGRSSAPQMLDLAGGHRRPSPSAVSTIKPPRVVESTASALDRLRRPAPAAGRAAPASPTRRATLRSPSSANVAAPVRSPGEPREEVAQQLGRIDVGADPGRASATLGAPEVDARADHDVAETAAVLERRLGEDASDLADRRPADRSATCSAPSSPLDVATPPRPTPAPASSGQQPARPRARARGRSTTET